MRINRENTIALVIDLQDKLVPTAANSKELISSSICLLKGLKLLKIPILVTQQNTKGLGPTIPEINKTIGNFSYIEKMTFSCYREPAFIRVLNRIGKRNVIIMGLETHVCILQTTLDLLYNNFNPVIVHDCVGSSSETDKEVAIWRMRDVGSVITTCESILFELFREAGTDEFKELLKLVKERKDA
ncbi:MAG: isochorismatase family protein [Bacteroidales bacterium]|nr:isochorismatase family protein [Bacteroidales bacterium]